MPLYIKVPIQIVDYDNNMYVARHYSDLYS